MKILNLAGRLALAVPGGAVDVEAASGGRFGPDIQAVYERWAEFVDWAAGYEPAGEPTPVLEDRLGPPVPRPPQVFAIGLNYKDHASEAGMELPAQPMVFTKFPAAITGPCTSIGLPEGKVDWEVELVAVVGRRTEYVAAEGAWSCIAGLTVGQDLSERILQTTASVPPQFSLGKSLRGFAPIGPALVTPDEFANVDDVAIGCALNGEPLQHGRTSDMIFSVSEIVAYLSQILPLLPGDLIFTGTPSGIGAAREPQRFITAGDVLTTYAEGIGEMRHEFRTLDPR
jgi:2-keto-4-pentenoate hydratase/2-oxohepta-3-ene-1,7-dioic acid hydratase in catechol pathway